MKSALSSIKEKCTARHVAIFFGLLSTFLFVAVVVLAVDNSNMSHDYYEARQKLEMLELFIQSMSTTTPVSEEITTTTPFSVPQPPLQTTLPTSPETAPPPPVWP
ncbi:uncharacterized protein [Musca autumnalis]|uniref:uncharacterized protein n=1 Tax=Musca autumnalis TaxID=221902 RepID=UPI003CE8212D